MRPGLFLGPFQGLAVKMDNHGPLQVEHRSIRIPHGMLQAQTRRWYSITSSVRCPRSSGNTKARSRDSPLE